MQEASNFELVKKWNVMDIICYIHKNNRTVMYDDAVRISIYIKSYT
jgi:hypothetical protein